MLVKNGVFQCIFSVQWLTQLSDVQRVLDQVGPGTPAVREDQGQLVPSAYPGTITSPSHNFTIEVGPGTSVVEEDQGSRPASSQGISRYLHPTQP
jgi:hypothetical protein